MKETKKPVAKPPIGLVPRHIDREGRKIEILAAMKRYFEAGMEIPLVWVDEYNELIRELKQR